MKNLLFFIFLVSCFSYSQEHAWVYFKDKANVEASLANLSLIPLLSSNPDARFAFSPRPVNEVLMIGTNGTTNFYGRLYDLQGQKILEKENVQSEIDLSGFSRGIYIAMFEQNNFRKSLLIIKK